MDPKISCVGNRTNGYAPLQWYGMMLDAVNNLKGGSTQERADFRAMLYTKCLSLKELLFFSRRRVLNSPPSCLMTSLPQSFHDLQVGQVIESEPS